MKVEIDHVGFAAAAVAALGSLAGTASQTSQMHATVDTDRQNALVAQQNAGTALEVSNANEEQQRQKARLVMGDQRASMAQAGTGLTSSTNQALAVQSAKNAEQDALNIRYGGILQAHQLMTESAADSWSAQVADDQINPTWASGSLAAGSAAAKAYAGYGG